MQNATKSEYYNGDLWKYYGFHMHHEITRFMGHEILA